MTGRNELNIRGKIRQIKQYSEELLEDFANCEEDMQVIECRMDQIIIEAEKVKILCHK